MIFEKAGPVVVEFPVEGIGASSGGAMKRGDKKDDMGGMKM